MQMIQLNLILFTFHLMLKKTGPLDLYQLSGIGLIGLAGVEETDQL